jgi:hypothetical protein
MKHTAIVVAAGLAFAVTLPAGPAFATQIKRTFVSAVGDDANVSTLCQPSAPCRTFATAYSVTIPNGEINVLDPGAYGTLIITKGLNIQGNGWAAITAQSGAAITVNAGPNDNVSLRGLTIEGVGTGATGIAFSTGQYLNIENCVIQHFTGEGINFNPSAASHLAVSNTLVAENGNNGILVLNGSGAVTAVFNRVEANHNGNGGIAVDGNGGSGTVNATVSGSVAAHNGTTFIGLRAGFVANSGVAQTTLMLFHSVAANNFTGINANGSAATLLVAQSMVTGNTSAGWNISSGTIQSYGDNYINGNGPNTGILGSVSKQ